MKLLVVQFSPVSRPNILLSTLFSKCFLTHAVSSILPSYKNHVVLLNDKYVSTVGGRIILKWLRK
jgi:hypothetical protein